MLLLVLWLNEEKSYTFAEMNDVSVNGKGNGRF